MHQNRPNIDQYYLGMAKLASSRSTCSRSKVGCVLVDVNDRVLSIGYNGPPAGRPHCIDSPCEGATSQSGTNLELCEAIHAEQSALLACKDITAIHKCYVTHSPCVFCTRLLLNTSCREIVFERYYPHFKSCDEWVSANRSWRNVQLLEL